jgi:hypothetical protein
VSARALRRIAFVTSVALGGCVTLGGPSPEIAGPSTLDTDALARASRRNSIAGDAILAGGGALGLASGGLLITKAIRDCPATNPDCNHTIDGLSNLLGAASVVVTATGIVFFAIGYTQKRVVQKLRGQRRGP